MKSVDDEQVAFGRCLGLDLIGKSVSEALAMIHDTIDRDFLGRADLGVPTLKQIEFAAKFQRDVASVSRRVADAVVGDLMYELNQTAILREQLAPGVEVRNIHDPFEDRRTISSIQADGTVYFKGGNGKRAWARNLVRVE